MSPSGAITFNRFTKRFGDTAAVEDLSFDVQPGRVVGLLGPNGAGKTTALRGLLGLIRPTSGSALVAGVPFERFPGAATRVGASLDGVGFEPGFSGRRQLEIAAAAMGAPASRVDAALREVGLAGAATRRVRGYSAGMRQRLALAAALLGDPELLVLDEPATGLDPEGIRWLRELLRRLASQGRTILLSSHQLAELAHTIDDVVVLRRRLLFAGTLTELTCGGRAPLERRYFDVIARGADETREEGPRAVAAA